MTAVIAAPMPRTKPADRLCGRDMLCFSHDWTGDPLSKTHLMRLLARDNRILWVNSIGYRTPTASRRDVGRAASKLAAALQPVREVEPNIFILNPLVIPAYGKPVVAAVNRHLLRFQVRRAMRKLGFRRPINWVFNPAAAVIAGELNEDLLIYYCVDEHAAFSGVPSAALAKLEAGLLMRADLVIASSELLRAAKSRVNARTVLVRHGVDYDHFRHALDPETVVPADIATLPRPVIGYFGLIATDWIDLNVLGEVARRFAHGSLVLIGKTTMDVSPLRQFPNVHLLGHRPYADLPAYCKGFDVALVPFPMNEATANSNPLKLREYLAAGLPVVSTPVPEVACLNRCRIADTPAAFADAIAAALDAPGSRSDRSELVRAESWAARLAEIRGHVAALPPEGESPC